MGFMALAPKGLHVWFGEVLASQNKLLEKKWGEKKQVIHLA